MIELNGHACQGWKLQVELNYYASITTNITIGKELAKWEKASLRMKILVQ